MNLGEFRKQTENLPDNVRIVYESFMDQYRPISGIWINPRLIDTSFDENPVYSELPLPKEEEFPTIIIVTKVQK